MTRFEIESIPREGAYLRAAVYCAVHGGDGREVDDLHGTLEVRVLHDLACTGGIAADDAAAAQVQHIAAILLRTCTHTLSGRSQL